MAKSNGRGQGSLGDATLGADDIRAALADDDAASAEELDAALGDGGPSSGNPGVNAEEPDPAGDAAAKALARAVPENGERKKVSAALGDEWGVKPDVVRDIIASVIVRENKNAPPPGDMHIMQACIIAHTYSLSPLLNHIYFFISKDGSRVIPVVGVDGWAHIADRSKRFDGVAFEYLYDDKNNLMACRCKVWLRGCSHPFENIEHLSECRKHVKMESQYPTPWRDQPHRMLRNRAFCQTVRLALGVGGIYDEDDARVVRDRDDAQPTRAQVIESRISGLAPDPD